MRYWLMFSVLEVIILHLIILLETGKKPRRKAVKLSKEMPFSLEYHLKMIAPWVKCKISRGCESPFVRWFNTDVHVLEHQAIRQIFTFNFHHLIDFLKLSMSGYYVYSMFLALWKWGEILCIRKWKLDPRHPIKTEEAGYIYNTQLILKSLNWRRVNRHEPSSINFVVRDG